ncbi:MULTISPECIES: hypothetical protein [unclassified Streptomyces]|uniref:hypothetical protein n=1 Tax=unclassified Streptomyces TaxID=2593676 RepID=UPI001F033DCA|nr:MULTISPECIES: hypothetical protein [unclassified Streptomyces]MCH0567277.1 hypothetical protein [Streptomyces sp. MUM 2J]MCH0572950.1 hypothetical protein [Streptomyces sp. MUM 136J]
MTSLLPFLVRFLMQLFRLTTELLPALVAERGEPPRHPVPGAPVDPPATGPAAENTAVACDEADANRADLFRAAAADRPRCSPRRSPPCRSQARRSSPFPRTVAADARPAR